MKENGGGENLSTIYFIYCKDFYKCHTVPPPNMIVKRVPKVLMPPAPQKFPSLTSPLKIKWNSCEAS
jgi:hypothetical protein